MNALPSHIARSCRLAAGLSLIAALALIAGPADASRPMPRTQPMPQQPMMPAQPQGHRFTCDTDIEGPASVRAAYSEFYDCVQPQLVGWMEKHSSVLPGLELLYDSWREARRHDLRDRPDAGRWARRHAVDFSQTEVELTTRQVSDLAPAGRGSAVGLPGLFQRFFVDRGSQRLFLTTDRDGLVSLDISERYAFALEGKVGTSGATDFFIVNETTAVVEETVAAGGNRDLVVLDISNRSQPREVARLRGAIPFVGGARSFHTGMTKFAPTFDQYLLIREGRLGTSSCGAPPTVSTHPGVHCRPDGSCYRREHLQEPNQGYCERVPPAQGRIAAGRIRRDLEGNWSSNEMVGAPPPPMPDLSRRDRVRAAPPMPSSAAESSSAAPAGRPQASRSFAQVEDSAAAEPPAGGAGGAGSLSQMMMYGNTLYVLSAAHGQPEGWLTTFDVTNPRRPAIAHVIKLDNGPEALQRHDSLLLVAGRDALVTASLGLSTSPRLLGEYRQECPVTFDPVVVQGSVAYRTIIVEQRNTACSSRLEVIELSQPHQPVLRTTRALVRPRGLAVLGERLFIADEARGVHVFDLTDAVNPTQAGTFPLQSVQDLIISGFDLYALAPGKVETYYVGPLYERGVNAAAGMERIQGVTTVERRDNVQVRDLQAEAESPDRPARRWPWR